MRSRVRMAIDAGKLGIVRRHLVAVGTDRVMVRDRKPGVVEGRAQPGCGRVADRASRGEARGNMVGTIRGLIVRLMAAKTIGWQGRVIVVYMTIRARDLSVSTRQWE